jgi:hypothetical protein
LNSIGSLLAIIVALSGLAASNAVMHQEQQLQQQEARRG